MIISATSHVMRKIWIVFLLIILILVGLIGFLMHGISIEHISLPKLKINGLYIKLDKKLIVSANEIKIQRNSKSKTSINEIYKLTNYFRYLNPIFQSIALKNIKYNNEIVSLLYKDNIFYFHSKYLTIDAIISISKKIVDVNLKQMILKDYGIELNGKLALNLKNYIYDYDGKFSLLNIDGQLKAKMEKNRVYYKLQTSSFKSLEPIMKYLKSKVFIEPIARDWIYKKIKAKEYKLNYLNGMFDLKTGEFFPLLMNGSATAKDATVKFNPHVQAAHVKVIKAKLENNTLTLNLTKPTYEKKNIKINDIHIYNILTSKSGIVVNLSSNTLLDIYVHNILKAFKINLPIDQFSGHNKSNIILNVVFRPYSINIKGTFIIKNSNFKLGRVNLFTKYAKIRLDNYKVFLDNSNLSYKKLFDINTTGMFQTNKKTYNGKVDINSLLIKIKNSPILDIYKLNNQSVSINFESNKSIFLLSDLATKLSFEKDQNRFEINDISKYKNYSYFIKDYNLSRGKLDILTKDFKNYKANLKLFNVQTPFIYKNKKIKNLDINILTNDDKIKAYTSDKKLQLFYDKKLVINIFDLNIMTNEIKSNKNKNLNMQVNGKGVNFKNLDFNSTILSNHFTMNIDKNSTKFISIYKNSQIGYESNAKNFSFEASKLNSHFIDKAFNSNIFKDGSFEISAKGDNKEIFDGKFIIKNSTLKDFSLFNNIMATINTIPSLVLFKNPNFNENGFVIKNGTIVFRKINNIISFNQIKLHGFNTDIFGSGYINMENKTINLDLEIRTLKDISNFMKNIPIVGYIMLGENKSISTNIEVSGPLKNPKIKTQILKDSLMSPLNIIKRTIESPLKIFQ